jgi:hypothetical protein
MHGRNQNEKWYNNTSLCLLNDHSKDMVFTYFLSISGQKSEYIQEERWQGRRSIKRLEILTWPYLTRRMGSYDFPIFNVEVKSKLKTCWLLCFTILTIRKLKAKECAENTHSSVVWFCNLQTL